MQHIFFVDYLERLENLAKSFRKEIAGLPPEAVDWSPGPEMNSVAVLLAHTTGSLRYWIGDAALGEPSGRVREREFQTRGISGEELMRRFDEVVAYARTALPKLSLESLGDVRRHDPESEDVTRAWALLHALDHGYLHLGHIQLTCQLWREKRT